MAECVCGDPNGRPGECPVHPRLPWMPPAEVWQPAGHEGLVDPPSFASGGVLPPRPPGDDSLLVELEPGYVVPSAGLTDEQRAVLDALARATGTADIALDREYSDEQLANSPYRELMSGAVRVVPDEYRSGPLYVVPDPGGPVITNLFAPVPDGPTDPVIAADARRRYVADLESLQSKAVDQLTRRVLAAIEGVEPRKDESTTGAMAAAAVDVFVEFLRTPPAIVTGVDGVTRVERR